MLDATAPRMGWDDAELLRDPLRRFIRETVAPAADAWERDGMVPRDVLREMGRLGFLGVTYPEAHGGAGMDDRATVVLAEELGRSGYGGFAITVLVHTDMASVHLHNAGTDAQRDRWMPGIVAGETITAVAVTEPGAGSDVKGIRTKARRHGDDWVLDGAKTYITNGVHADLLFVAAVTDPDAAPGKGVSIFAVERGAPGFSVSRTLDKHGWLSSDTAELRFESCVVPGDHLIGEPERGFYAIMQNFQNERLVLGAMAMGEAQAALDLTVDYVKTRTAFGAPLWEKQAIRQRLAMLQARVSAARSFVYATAERIVAGEDATREVSMIKALCGELVNEVMYDCVQFHGGMGYMHGSAIERMTRDARIHAIGGGATEVMLEEVAKRM